MYPYVTPLVKHLRGPPYFTNVHSEFVNPFFAVLSPILRTSSLACIVPNHKRKKRTLYPHVSSFFFPFNMLFASVRHASRTPGHSRAAICSFMAVLIFESATSHTFSINARDDSGRAESGRTIAGSGKDMNESKNGKELVSGERISKEREWLFSPVCTLAVSSCRIRLEVFQTEETGTPSPLGMKWNKNAGVGDRRSSNSICGLPNMNLL